jgi:very-short-patch-repair endonuclease
MPERRNSPPTVKRAKRLRGAMTEAEKKLWYRIRLKQIGGRYFRRQVSIGDYAVDFACLTEKLVIEVDGGQHDWRKEEDEVRTRYDTWRHAAIGSSDSGTTKYSRTWMAFCT